jgi:hypothetical protein
MRRSAARRGAIALLAALAASPGAAPAFAAELSLALGGPPGAVPVVLRVTKGEAVTLHLSGDRPVAVHVHGYNLSASVAPGRPQALRFTAHATGRFPIHVHPAGEAAGARHGAPAAFLEVHPR